MAGDAEGAGRRGGEKRRWEEARVKERERQRESWEIIVERQRAGDRERKGGVDE